MTDMSAIDMQCISIFIISLFLLVSDYRIASDYSLNGFRNRGKIYISGTNSQLYKGE